MLCFFWILDLNRYGNFQKKNFWLLDLQADAPEGASEFCSRNIFSIEVEYTLFKFSISLFEVNPSHLHFLIYKSAGAAPGRRLANIWYKNYFAVMVLFLGNINWFVVFHSATLWHIDDIVLCFILYQYDCTGLAPGWITKCLLVCWKVSQLTNEKSSHRITDTYILTHLFDVLNSFHQAGLEPQ